MDAPDKTTEGPYLQRLHIVDARAAGAYNLPSNLNSCTLCRSKLPAEARDLAIVQLHAAETTILLRSATRVHANRDGAKRKQIAKARAWAVQLSCSTRSTGSWQSTPPASSEL